MKNLNPDHFPDLKSEVLQRFAGEWAKEYPIIKNVMLFRGIHGSHKYAIVVTLMVNTITDTGIMRPETISLFQDLFGSESCSHIQEDLASAYNKDLPIDEVTGERRLPDEWIWFPMGLEDELPTDFIVPEFSWVLYGEKEKQRQISARAETEQGKERYPQEVIELLTKAKNEIEDLYKGMKANRLEPDEELEETYEGSLKYAAEQWFNANKNNYKVIARQHVGHHHLYFTNTKKEVPDIGHIRRDFKGKLCQVLISETFRNKYIPDLNRPSKGFGIKTLYKLLKSF